MNQHTPTPWKTEVVKDDKHTLVYMRIKAGPKSIAFAGVYNGDGAEANARFIVTACNCHEELVDALKTTLEALLSWQPLFDEAWDHGDDNAVKIASQALDKAKGEQR